MRNFQIREERQIAEEKRKTVFCHLGVVESK